MLMEELLSVFSSRDLSVTYNVWLHLKQNNISLDEFGQWFETRDKPEVLPNKPARPWDFIDPRTEYAISEDISKRLDLCKVCEFMMVTGQCTKCGCFMKLKSRLAHAQCPIGKWNSVKGNKLDVKKVFKRTVKPIICSKCGSRVLVHGIKDPTTPGINSLLTCGNKVCNYSEFSTKTVRELLHA